MCCLIPIGQREYVVLYVFPGMLARFEYRTWHVCTERSCLSALPLAWAASHPPLFQFYCWLLSDITGIRVNSSQTFADDTGSHTYSKICGPERQKIMRELFCAGGPCLAGGCVAPHAAGGCNIGMSLLRRGSQPRAHSLTASSLPFWALFTTIHITLCTQALSTGQRDPMPVPAAWPWTTTQWERRTTSSATETAELQPCDSFSLHCRVAVLIKVC